MAEPDFLKFTSYNPASGLTLTHLELRVLLADDIKTTFASDDLAIIAALLDGCFDFHIVNIFICT